MKFWNSKESFYRVYIVFREIWLFNGTTREIFPIPFTLHLYISLTVSSTLFNFDISIQLYAQCYLKLL